MRGRRKRGGWQRRSGTGRAQSSAAPRRSQPALMLLRVRWNVSDCALERVGLRRVRGVGGQAC